jgi:PAS domain S-box-containing protein
VPGALPFTVGCLFGAAAAACSVMGYAAVDMTARVAWYKVQAVLQLPIITALFCFILEFAWPGRWLTRRNLILLAIAPVVYLGLIMTNDLHHLAWRSYQVQGTVHPELALVGWLFVAYGFLILGGVNLFILGWLFWRFPQHRWPVALMLGGQLGGHLGWTLARAGIISSSLPITILAMDLEFFVYAVAFFGFRILDPIPMARNTAIEQLQVGMIVLDPGRKIVSLNPSARAILGTTKNHILHRPIREFLPVMDKLAAADQAEIQLGAGPAARAYQLDISFLKDWRGFEVGHLLMIRDVTEQKRAGAEILEQQRALAILRERDRLARELHDELAQGLSLINLQAQLVCGLLDAGQMEQAKEQLQVLARAARDAQVDVRGEISKLAHGILSEEGFTAALRRITENFQQANGIPTELVLPCDDGMFAIAPTVEAQLLRIVQEAFTNIRKHARAKHVNVSLQKEAGCLEVLIQDDGIGFDRDGLPASRTTFGLDIMHERAAEINGRVEIQSAVGRGTMVRAEVPLGKP